MKKIPYTEPEFNKTAFNCPFCNAFSGQFWVEPYRHVGAQNYYLRGTKVCFCGHCDRYSIWYDRVMVYPNFQGVEPPNQDLEEDIQKDYIEAAEIFQRSPRGAAALLRLAIQKVCIQLGEKGKNINTDIGNLVKKGLPAKVQESLDALRVVGNEAVHPGEMDLRDNIEIAGALFKSVNFIAEKMISEPNEIEELYKKIPENKKEQIKERDNAKKDE